MPEIVGLILLGMVAVAIWWYRRWSSHITAVGRVQELEAGQHVRVIPVEPLAPLWSILLPWVLGLGGYAVAVSFVPMGQVFCVSIGFLLFVIGWIITQTVVGRRIIKIESQLAEAIDHLVTSLHAGIGVVDSLTSAEKDVRRPLKPHITHLLMRLRLGDDPPEVCRDMAEVLPLESFRIFYYALGVQWEGGGNLAPTLATTGRFIRDRVELGRRVRARATEARFSVLAVLALTYFLAGLMWNIDPERVEGFLMTNLGEIFVSSSIVLQAIGAAWVAKLSNVEY
jgi:Flp pilus assembly protein TadB